MPAAWTHCRGLCSFMCVFSFQLSRYFRFTFVSYNILSQNCLEENKQLYDASPPEVLEWDHRKHNLLKEIMHFKADIIALQVSPLSFVWKSRKKTRRRQSFLETYRFLRSWTKISTTSFSSQIWNCKAIKASINNELATRSKTVAPSFIMAKNLTWKRPYRSTSTEVLIFLTGTTSGCSSCFSLRRWVSLGFFRCSQHSW